MSPKDASPKPQSRSHDASDCTMESYPILSEVDIHLVISHASLGLVNIPFQLVVETIMHLLFHLTELFYQPCIRIRISTRFSEPFSSTWIRTIIFTPKITQVSSYLCTYSVASPGESYCMIHLTLGKSKPLAATSVDNRRADFSVLKAWNVALRSSCFMFPCSRRVLNLTNVCLSSASSSGLGDQRNSLINLWWKSTASHVEKKTTICRVSLLVCLTNQKKKKKN